MTRPPLPRRTPCDEMRRVIDADPGAPEVHAAVRAALPHVAEPIKAELHRIYDRLARLVAEVRGGAS